MDHINIKIFQTLIKNKKYSTFGLPYPPKIPILIIYSDALTNKSFNWAH